MSAQVRYLARSLPDGTTIFYREAGTAGAPTLLLLHGFPTSSHMFRDLIPLLAERFHVVAPDLPGFGQTTTPEGYTFTFDNLARSVSAFVDALGLERFALYVFDYGAPVGFRLALERPSRIGALISQNGNAYEEGLSDGWNPIRAYWADKSPANRNALRGFLAPDSTKWQYATGADETRLSPDGYSLDNAYLARPGQDDVQLDLFGDYAANVALYPAFQRWLRESRTPVLAVWGRHDPFFLPQGAEAFRRDAPDAAVHLLDTGHFALETHTSEIADLITEFLTGVGRGIGAGSPVDPVRAFYDALGRGDVLAVLGLLDPAVEWTEAETFPYYSGTWVGPDAVRDNLLARLAQDWDGFAAVADEYVAQGETVVSMGNYSGTFKRSGKYVKAAFAHRWTVRDGKIKSFLMYTDTAKILEAIK